MSTAEGPTRLSFEHLDWAMQALPEWQLHSSRLSLSRELLFVTPGRAFRFLTAASLWSHGRRQWPLFTLEKARVWVTIRNLEHGITERDLALARQLESLYRHCAPEPRAPAPPSYASAGDPALEDWSTEAGVDRLVERTVAAARRLIAELKQSRPTEAPAVPEAEARTAPTAKLKSERIQGMLEALPDWRPTDEGDVLATAYAFGDSGRAQDFADLARELIGTEGLPVELGPSEGCLVRATVRATDVRGLSERELAAAAALDRLYHGGR